MRKVFRSILLFFIGVIFIITGFFAVFFGLITTFLVEFFNYLEKKLH